MSQKSHDDFSQLRNAFNDPVAPAPSFAVELKERVMQEAAVTSNAADSQSAGITRASMSKAQVIRMPMLAATGWKSAFVTAATILIVLALGFGSLRSVIQRNGGGETNHTGQIGIPVASPEAIASDDILAGGRGGSDRGWHLGPVADQLEDDVVPFDLLNAEIIATPDDSQQSVGVPVIVDSQIYRNTLVLLRQNQDGSSTSLQAIDLQGGQVLWTQPVNATFGIAIDEAHVYVYAFDQLTSAAGLIAFDRLTGEKVWQANNSENSFNQGSQGPIVVDGMVYMNNGPLTMYAVNADTGAKVWSITRDATVDLYKDNTGGPWFAVEEDNLYWVREGYLLEAVDRQNGDSVWEQRMTDAPSSNTALWPTFSVTSDAIYATTKRITIESDDNAVTTSDQKIIAVEKDTGQMRWSKSVNDFVSNLVVSGDRVLITTSRELLALATTSGEEVDSLPYSGTYEMENLKVTGNRLFSSRYSRGTWVLTEYSTNPLAEIQSWRLPDDIPGIALPYAWQGNLIIVKPDGYLGIIRATALDPTPELATISARDSGPDPLSAGWGGADRSWNLGPLPAHLDSSIALDEISGSPSGGYGPAQTFGNIIIRQLEGSASNPRSSLQAIDLSAQSVLWTINVATTGRMASDGQRLFAFKYDHAKGAYGLIAIDLLSGNILWQFDDPTSTSEEVDGPGPLVFDGVVYMFDGPQAFYALDAITGEQIWNVTQDRKLTNEINQPITNTTGQNVRTLPPLMAVDDNALYVVTGYQFIEALDRKTGASLWEHEFASPPEEGMLDAAIAIDTGHVYVATQTVRWVLPLVVNQPMLHAYSNAKVIAYDKTSGESVWESEILNFQSTMVFASNHLVLSTGKSLVLLNLSTGDIVTSYDLAVTQESQHQQWLGSSGDTVFIILENGESTTLLRFQIPQIDGAMTRLTGQWDLPEELSRMRLRLPTVSVWNGNLVLIGETGTIGLITRRPAR